MLMHPLANILSMGEGSVVLAKGNHKLGFLPLNQCVFPTMTVRMTKPATIGYVLILVRIIQHANLLIIVARSPTTVHHVQVSSKLKCYIGLVA